jgi:hypothetical protein
MDVDKLMIVLYGYRFDVSWNGWVTVDLGYRGTRTVSIDGMV